ncbi:hypothetical protein [Streptomyces sp. NPDC091371]|uniref:hypothetical protein n=1 Tax=Streptomyces sp. NPDC091371 TaxID=3155303 RepID=UPI00342D2747
MTRTPKTPRFTLLAASVAAGAAAVLFPAAAGAAPFPATAFAASPATVAADGADGNGSSAVGRGTALPDGPGSVIDEDPPENRRPKPWWAPGPWWEHHRNQQWQCVAAPCEPPGSPAGSDPDVGGGAPVTS